MKYNFYFPIFFSGYLHSCSIHYTWMILQKSSFGKSSAISMASLSSYSPHLLPDVFRTSVNLSPIPVSDGFFGHLHVAILLWLNGNNSFKHSGFLFRQILVIFSESNFTSKLPADTYIHLLTKLFTFNRWLK